MNLGTYLGTVSHVSGTKARFYVPQVFGKVESAWAPPAIKAAKAPKVGDLLYVAFNAGDITKPIYFPTTPDSYTPPVIIPRSFELTRNSAFAVATATYVKVQFTVVNYANPSNPFTLPADFVMPTGWGGYWDFKWLWNWAPNATGGRIAQARYNGDTTITGGTQFTAHATNGASINGVGNWNESTVMNALVNDGDKLEWFVYQNSGASINCNSVTMTASRRPS